MNKMILHVCENLKQEVKEILKIAKIPDIEVNYFPSFCGTPPIHSEHISFKAEADISHLAIGSVCLNELKNQNDDKLAVITEDNCFYFILNNKLVDHYILDGAYLITPGWLQNWQKHIDIWKFDQQTARDFFAESCKYLLFLDTGVYENMESHLADFSDFIQVEAKTLPVGLEYFELKLRQIIQKYTVEADLAEIKKKNLQAQRQVSEYAMAMDLIGKLTKSQNEKEAVDNILQMMNMLFAPGELFYLSFQKNLPHKLYSKSGSEVLNEEVWDKLSKLKEKYQWSPSEKGFCLAIKYKNEFLGALHIDDLAFPQYKEHYLNLGLFLVDICSLAISNARAFQLVESQKTELVNSYVQLQTSEEKYRLLFKNMINGFALHEIVTDEKGKPIDYMFLEVNNAFERLTGLKRDEILLKKATNVIPDIEKDPADWIDKYGKVALAGKETRFEQHSEQLNKWFSVLAFCPKEGQFATIFEDITARKSTEENIKNTKEHIELINSLLWHDVTNSFSVLNSAIRLFRRSADMSLLDEANNQIQKGVELIRTMRQLNETLLTSNKLELIEMKPLIVKIAQNYNIPLSVLGNCTALADEAIKSIIDNLISNVIKHANATEIIIELKQEKDQSLILIKDDGIGIPDEFKHKVFEKSFKMGKTGNTGLGLYIVQKTIERYGGRIEIKDNAPKGTIFEIELKAK